MKNLLQKFRIFRKITAVLVTTALSALPLLGEDVYVTSYYGLASSTDLTPCPHSCSTGFSTFGASASSSSTATPTPPVPATGRKSIFGLSTGAMWSVTPTNATYSPVSGGPYVFTALTNTGVYKIYITKGQSNNGSTNIIVTMTAIGGDLATTNGVGSAAIELDVYQKDKVNHEWVHVGYITNSIASPTVKFTHTGGLCNNTDANNNNAQRWYVDVVRFEFVTPCSGVAPQPAIAGPLVNGQSFVNVTGVVAGATNVTIYGNSFEIGQTNFAGGFAAGALSVPTTALFQGQVIAAIQSKDGCTSTLATSGPVVGGGPNAQIKAFLSLYKNSAFTGPAGASTPNASTNSTQYFLKGSSLVGGFGTAPVGGEELIPSRCWQTVVFNHTNDSSVGGNSGLPVTNNDSFCSLDGLLFAMNWDNLDSGPHNIYIDQIKNGDIVIEDFETYGAGTTNMFVAPILAVTPTPSSTYLPGINSSSISTNNSFDGNNSCLIEWQWSNANFDRWARVMATGTAGKLNPQLDVTKSITIRYLILPVGQTTDQLSFTSVPANQTKSPGENATFSVVATGEAPFTYQWQFAGGDLAGETANTLTKSNVQLADAGVYTVVVTGATGCSASHEATLTVSEVVNPPTLNYSVSAGQITFTWSGNFTLQFKTAVNGATWTTITPTSGYSESLSSSTTKFFRLNSAP